MTSGRYDFDRTIDRLGTGSLKYDFARQFTGREDLLPMWVADMDFAVPDEIVRALHQRVDHGIFGYTMPEDSYYEVLKGWFARRYGYEIDREWNTIVPGVVYGVTTAIRALTSPGDAILIQEPVYHPFRRSIQENGRVCVNEPLMYRDGRYLIDMDRLEKAIVSNRVKAMIICSPHNPVGRVWTVEELSQIDEICRRHQVKVIADEIHCDFIYPGSRFTSFGTLGEESLQNAVICTSPSKTFNLAGMQISNILIPNEELRARFREENEANGYGLNNVLGLVAGKSAYEHGEEWLEELISYLWGNVCYVRGYLKDNLPDLRLVEPEGTYLLWMDFTGAFDDPDQLEHLIRDKARLWLDNGGMFGQGSELFERFNIACPRKTLERAMDQLQAAFK